MLVCLKKPLRNFWQIALLLRAMNEVFSLQDNTVDNVPLNLYNL